MPSAPSAIVKDYGKDWIKSTLKNSCVSRWISASCSRPLTSVQPEMYRKSWFDFLASFVADSIYEEVSYSRLTSVINISSTAAM
jgi:hypothetical protein